MAQINISVVTVTYNNSAGLDKTLSSLAKLVVKPLEVIIIDGGSRDDSHDVVKQFSDRLPIRFLSERDKGIYDAMNKGRRQAAGTLIHYLNAGDEVYGVPYLPASKPYLLPVRVTNPADGTSWVDRIKLFGYGYCHQGVIFPSGHDVYDTDFTLAADLDMIVRTFPNGLRNLDLNSEGGVVYYLGGVSSVNSERGDREIGRIFRAHLGLRYYIAIALMLGLKRLLPRTLRRAIARTFATPG